MSYELIAGLMFSTLMLMMLTGQRVFGAIGFVAVVAALWLWGTGGSDMGYSAVMKLMKWNALLTLPMFIFMGYVMSETKLAADLYRMFHVWFGPIPGGLAIGTILLMVMISAMNGLSVAGMAIGATIALPQLAQNGYRKEMISGVIQAGSSLGILIPPSVVLVLYAMIARQPVGQLWLAGVVPGLLMAGIFIVYIAIRTWLNPEIGPPLSKEARARRNHHGREDQTAARRAAAHLHLLRHHHSLRHGLGQPHRGLRPRRTRHGVGGGRREGPLHLGGVRNRHGRPSPSPACSCSSSLRPCPSAPSSTASAPAR